jgi:hypothetical protein
MREAERAKEDTQRLEEVRQAESAALHRRLKEDTDHALHLCRQREQAASQRVDNAQSDANIARARTMEVEAALMQARQAIMSGPNEALRDAVASAEAETSSLKRALAEANMRCEQQRIAKEEARAHVLRLAQELARAREAMAADKEAAMEKLRIAWLAREERYVLDGDREVLRSIRMQADQVREGAREVNLMQETEGEAPRQQPPPVAAALSSPTPSSGSSAAVFAGYVEQGTSSSQGTGVGMGHTQPSMATTMGGEGGSASAPSTFESSAAAGTVVDRLKAERRALLASGQPFTAGHPLVRRIDRALHAAEGAYRQLRAQGK